MTGLANTDHRAGLAAGAQQAVTGEDRLVSLVRRRGYPHATAADDLLELGFTSLDLLQLGAEIEQEFGVAVDIAIVLTAPTIGELNKQLLE
jgi:hypothetical protein